MIDLPALRESVRASAENRPGVYRMHGPDDETLYVGKSVRVRSRLLAYFRAPEGEKAHELIRTTARISWDYVTDEFGALVKEMRLIQRFRPRFNVQHKRKRSWAFVKITREPAPRLIPVRRPIPDGGTYSGPFPAVNRTILTVRELANAIGMRDCAASVTTHFDDQPELFEFQRSPLCIRGETGSCLSPCSAACSSSEYADRVRMAREFLAGEADEPVVRVEAAMADAVGRMDFEYAQVLRDRAVRLRRFQEDLAAFRGEVEGLSFAYPVRAKGGRDRIYLIRRGTVRAAVPRPSGARERRAALARVREVFASSAPGPAGLEWHEASEILLVARWFRLHPEERTKTLDPSAWADQVAARLPSSRVISPATAPRSSRIPRDAPGIPTIASA
jgi:excinuclease ABC subunit C